MALFERTTTLDPASPRAPLEAYKEGRRDERRLIETGGPDHRAVKKELDEAFSRGRLQGRSERRSSLMGGLATLILAVLIAASAVMYLDYGSFGGAGVVLDRWIATL